MNKTLYSVTDCRKASFVVKNGVWGVAPRQGRRDASPRILPRHGCRACMHKGFARCKANQAYTAFHGGKGFGVRDSEISLFLKNRLFLQAETLYSVINIIIICSRPLRKAKISTLFSQGRNLGRHIAVDCLKGSNICSRPLCKAKISTLFSQGRSLGRHIAAGRSLGRHIAADIGVHFIYGK